VPELEKLNGEARRPRLAISPSVDVLERRPKLGVKNLALLAGPPDEYGIGFRSSRPIRMSKRAATDSPTWEVRNVRPRFASRPALASKSSQRSENRRKSSIDSQPIVPGDARR
jgi:hypothetical protein